MSSSQVYVVNMICVKYMWLFVRRISMSLQMLWVVLFRSLRQLMVCIWMVPLIFASMYLFRLRTEPLS